MATSRGTKEIDLSGIKPEQICDNVIKRLEIEQISRYFEKHPSHFKGSQISYTNKDGVIIKFKTLKTKYPIDYDTNYYRVLVIFKIYNQDIFTDHNVLLLLTILGA